MQSTLYNNNQMSSSFTWYLNNFKKQSIRIMFGTRATLHVRPWWFGEYDPTYKCNGASNTVGADGTLIETHGVRTIYFNMTEDKYGAIVITFAVCDVQEAILHSVNW